MQKRARYCDVNAESTELEVANSSIQPSINEAATSSPDTTISNDCFSVSHYYAEVNSLSSPLLLAAGARDVDETDESEVSDVHSFRSADAVKESLSSEGSESDPGNISDGAEEQAGGMMDFVRDAVLRLVEIKGTVGFSIRTFEDLLKWGANLQCVNNEEARGLRPSSWEDVQTLLGDLVFICPSYFTFVWIQVILVCMHYWSPKQMFILTVANKEQFLIITLVFKTKTKGGFALKKCVKRSQHVGKRKSIGYHLNGRRTGDGT